MTAVDGAAARERPWQDLMIVVLAAITAYAAALAGTFVYDDLHAVVGNAALRSLGNVGRFFIDPTAFSGNGSAMYRPVLLTTLAVDHALGDGEAWPFKLGNLLIHATCAALLLRWLRGHGLGRLPALAAALLFAVHPLASEAVNGITSRSETLCALGALTAMLGHAAMLRGRRRGAVAVFVGAFVACGSKETGALVPALLLAQEWAASTGSPGATLRTQWRRILGRLWPALIVVAVYLVVRRVLFGMATASLMGRVAGDPMVGATRDLATQFATMGSLLSRSLLQMLAPLGLSIDPHVTYLHSPLHPASLCGWSALAILTWLGVRRGRTAKARTLGVVLAWVTALPWVVIPLNMPLAEHRLYGPLLGLAAVLAALLEQVELRVAAAAAAGAAPRRRWCVGAAVVGVAFTVLAALRSFDYRDDTLLWRGAIAADPLSFRTHWGLGTALLLRRDYREAEASLARAVALHPGFRIARRNQVEALQGLPPEEGWPFRELAVIEQLVAEKDDDPYYRLLHATALYRVGMLTGDDETLRRAEQRALSCHEVGSTKGSVFRLAAQCCVARRDGVAALAYYDRAIAIGLDQPAVLAERAEALLLCGRADEAGRALRSLLRRAPLDPAVHRAWDRYASAAPR